MEENETYHSINWQSKLRELGVCVIIPTYNNSSTILQVIEDVKQYTLDIIVVCDGPTDGTLEAVQMIEGIDLVSYPVNKGKGYALRKGFKHALQMGFRYAITIDSDGQHFASDIPIFIEKLRMEPGSLIVGARKMEGQDQNKKSGFANRFSNFWYLVHTLQSLPDTQSGYRLYPLEKVNKIWFVSVKYEFEVEILVKSAWRGINVTSVPVNVYYPPAEKRISHFKPGKDFTRISLLNTYLTLFAIVYGHWMVMYRALTYQNIKAFLRRNFLNKDEPVWLKACSVGFGVFMGIVPIWGWQMIVAGTLAHFMKLNKAIVILSANISIPPIVPFIVYLSYETGALLMPENMRTKLDFAQISEDPAKFFLDSGLQYLSGSMLLAVISGLAFGIVSYVTLSLFKTKTEE